MDGDGDDVAGCTEKNIDFTHFNWVKTLMIKEKKRKRVVARPRLEKFVYVSCLYQTVEV